MKVYELIQELSQFNAETEIKFKADINFDVDVKATFDRDNENDIQEVTVNAEFDDLLDYDDIINNQNKSWDKNITIVLTY